MNNKPPSWLATGRGLAEKATEGEWFQEAANVNHVSGAPITTTWTRPPSYELWSTGRWRR